MEKPPILWLNVLVVVILPIFTLLLVPLYGLVIGYNWVEWCVFAFFMVATGLSITAGYHRLWSHRTYEAHVLVRLFFAIFGACGLQNSILAWSSDHRRHHKYVDDRDRDPYSIKRGFWFAHMGWILRDYQGDKIDFSNVKDLQRDPIVRWQHRHYLLIALLSNSALLMAIGWMNGQLWGAFLLAGLLRIVLNHHFTFFINSLAHFMGKQPYSDKNTSKDNYIMAFLTYGEGYHNYHHSFQYDYRNGVRWYHFDPAKWVIGCLAWLGLAHSLRRPSKVQIEKARVKMQFKRAMQKLESQGTAESLQCKLEEAYQQFQDALEAWSKFKKEWVKHKKQALKANWERTNLKIQYTELKYELRLQRQKWRLLCAHAAHA